MAPGIAVRQGVVAQAAVAAETSVKRGTGAMLSATVTVLMGPRPPTTVVVPFCGDAYATTSPNV
jgi:hypothetical protein